MIYGLIAKTESDNLAGQVKVLLKGEGEWYG